MDSPRHLSEENGSLAAALPPFAGAFPKKLSAKLAQVSERAERNGRMV